MILYRGIVLEKIVITQTIYILEQMLSFGGQYLTMDYKFANRAKKNLFFNPIIFGFVYSVIYRVCQLSVQKLFMVLTGDVRYAAIFLQVGTFAVSYLFVEGKFGRRLWAFGIYYIPALFSEVLLMPVFMNRVRLNPLYAHYEYMDFVNDENLFVVCVLLEAQVIIVIWFLLVLLTKIYIDKIWPKKYLAFICFGVYQIVFFYSFFRNAEKYDRGIIWEGFALFIFGIFIECMIISVVNAIFKEKVSILKLENMIQTREAEKVYAQIISNDVEQLRMIRHDLRNNLQIVFAGIDRDWPKEKTKGILRELSDDIDRNLAKNFCSNQIVNTILVLKNKEAMDAGIQMKVSCNVPKELPISNLDICTVFCNSIDNAIEATQKTEDDSLKEINVNCGIVNDYLILKVTNPCSENIVIRGVMPSTKDNPKEHGMGIRIMKQIAAEHNGTVQLKCEEKQFETMICLQIKNDD